MPPSGNSARATARSVSQRRWHLSPEQSLLLHAENTVIPTQVVVYSPKGANNTMNLLFGTSLYDLKTTEMPAAADFACKGRPAAVLARGGALVRITEPLFSRNPIETQVVLGGISDASDVLRLLLNGGHSAKAGILPERSGASGVRRLQMRSSRR